MTAGEQQTQGLPKVAGSSPQKADDELLQAREMELTTSYLQDVGRREQRYNELKLAGKNILQYALLLQPYKSNVGKKTMVYLT